MSAESGQVHAPFGRAKTSHHDDGGESSLAPAVKFYGCYFAKTPLCSVALIAIFRGSAPFAFGTLSDRTP